MSLYIRPSSQHYEYARRVAAGEESSRVVKLLGINKNTAKSWRYQLRRAARREEGVKVSYPVAVMLALLPQAERKAVIEILHTQCMGDFAPDAL